MPVDREAALKRAEKLLRQGKLDGAIEEYVRLVEDQPGDWNSINALGDLYVRAGDADNAVAQFTRVADHLFSEGFLARAAALYKKALKVKSEHEHTLLRLADIAARQGLCADARAYLRQLASQRRLRRDDRGVAECLIRLGTLEEADAESKIAGARAAASLGDSGHAVALLTSAAQDLERQNRHAEALEAWAEAVQLDPADVELRARLARECVHAGQFERARAFLTEDTAGDDPDLLLALARLELSSGNDQYARRMLTRLATAAPARVGDVMQLVQALLKDGRIESAFGCVDVVTDAALLSSDWDAAVAMLQTFVRDEPYMPALIKLVEICVDAGLDAPLRDAQAQLAAAYIAAGRGSEARVIAEDLVHEDPASEAYVQLLRRALELLAVEDVEGVVAERMFAATEATEGISVPGVSHVADEPLAAASLAMNREDLSVTASRPESVDHGFEGGERTLPAASAEESTGAQAFDDAIVLSAAEIDLSDALADMHTERVSSVPPSAPPATGRPEDDLESLFDDVRARVAREPQVAEASAHYARGVSHLREGRVTEAIADLQAAARVPLLRFPAAAQLGRLYSSRADFEAAVDWLERAAEAVPPAPQESFAVLYDLADALEHLGEGARALAILIELDADAGEYRDVRERIGRLARAQTGSGQR